MCSIICLCSSARNRAHIAQRKAIIGSLKVGGGAFCAVLQAKPDLAPSILTLRGDFSTTVKRFLRPILRAMSEQHRAT